jgi:D-alanyl-D-alanine carboxypeptidase
MRTSTYKLPLVLFSLFLVSSYSQNESTTTKVKERISNVFNYYVSQTNALNPKGIAYCISNERDFYWLEDGELKYSNKAALVDDLNTFLPDVKSIEFLISRTNIQVLSKEQATLYAEYSKDIFLKSGSHFRFDGALSLVLVMEQGSWKFLQGHSSHIKPLDNDPQLKGQLQEALDSIVKQYELPGMTFSVLFEKGHQICLASGYCDVESKIRMQPNTRMLAGSVGKIFVSTLVLKLVQEGKLKLDDKANSFFTDSKWFLSFPNSSDIKIRNLLNHTSGLPDYLYEPEFLEAFVKSPRIKRNPIDAIQSVSDKPAVHAVDNGWSYSDTNYILLGLIIEKVTGTDLYKLLASEFINPLKLDLTSPSNQLQLENLCQGYIGSRNPFHLPKKVLDSNGKLVLDPSVEWAAGGLISNPRDLTTFMKFIYESDYLNEESKTLLTAAVNTKTGKPDDVGYGLGTFIWKNGDGLRYGHSGFFPGYLSHVEYVPKMNYALGIQLNTDQGFQNLHQYISILDTIIDEHIKQ